MSKSRWFRCKTKEEVLKILGMDKPADKPVEEPVDERPEPERRPNGVRVVKGGGR